MAARKGLWALGSRSLSTSAPRGHARVREYPKAARKPLLVDPLYASPHTKRFRVVQNAPNTPVEKPKMTFFVRPPPSITPPTMAIEFNRENLPINTSSNTGSSHPLLNKSSNYPSSFIPNNPLLSYSSTSSSDLSPPMTPYAHHAPPLRPEKSEKPLAQSTIQEIYNLRINDPLTWTVGKLSREFDCSPRLIMAACADSPTNSNTTFKVASQLNAVKDGWGRKRKTARIIRQARRELW